MDDMDDKKPIDPEIAAIARKYLLGILALETRESENCLHCGEHIEALEQVGECVYARPCGCRLWQGEVPDAWKNQNS